MNIDWEEVNRKALMTVIIILVILGFVWLYFNR